MQSHPLVHQVQGVSLVSQRRSVTSQTESASPVWVQIVSHSLSLHRVMHEKSLTYPYAVPR